MFPLFNRIPKEIDPPEGDQDVIADRIGDDIAKAVDEWIRPELAKIIGWPAVNKIKDQDFDSALQTQYKMLFLKKSHTVRKTGATFHFKLCQGIESKHTVLSKFKYEIEFEDYNPTGL